MKRREGRWLRTVPPVNTLLQQIPRVHADGDIPADGIYQLQRSREQEDNHVRVGLVVETVEHRRALVVVQVQLERHPVHQGHVDRLAQEEPAGRLGEAAGRGELGDRVEQPAGSDDVAFLVVSVVEFLVDSEDHDGG